MASLVRTTTFVTFAVTLWVTSSGSFFPVGSRVLARTSDSSYRHGMVTAKKGSSLLVTLDSGDQIEHSLEDITAIVRDSAPPWVTLGDHVIAVVNRSKEYLIGFVTEDFCLGKDDLYEITFDNNQLGNCTLEELRKLPFFYTTRQSNVGARVFALWKDNVYYRGFVKGRVYQGKTLYLEVQLDHSGSISHQASDERAVVLDVIPLYTHVHATQRVIGYFPGYAAYLPGWVVKRNAHCWKAAYRVIFDIGEERDQNFNEVRLLPPHVQLF